ncbi:MAG: glutamate:gamma-aminobutyrate antiporter [Paraclostridium bifermentans]|uniref:glutamate:gamma-aminobutyrate antiporter n=1 Tax=Paraclostridium bifermentans TaxID=1490 RepID=UPI001D4D4B14|nr:glutamate:gamma-aminobutyrate antiporter [Paraclostridium bifermentans]MBS6509981.1 glutamate:gamma-aminobutyrate antiporter [Paraclostridium bifermentans]
MKEENAAKGNSLTLFAFFAMTASMVMTVYEYPTFATSGFNLVFFLLLGGILWFLPVALCAAEMATVDGWQEGGIFAWVGNTLGERFGFAAIFFQWFQITVGFVTMIYFILGCFSYIFNWNALNNVPVLKFIAVLVVFWGLTLSQLGGTKNTAKIAKAGFILGIAIPAIILFGISIAYLVQGNPIDVKIGARYFVPDFSKVNTLVVFVSFILAYMGVEASASHVNELENSKRNYPLAMIILVIVAIVLNTIGGLTVAAVIPQGDLNLSSGVVDTFKVLILHFIPNGTWIVKLIALLLALGVMGEVSAWVVGPSRGMYIAAQKGILPKSLTKTNKHDVPVNLVFVQGIVVTIWAAVLTLGGGGDNVSFLTAISLTVVIYLVGYLLFFIGYFKLILKRDDLKRSYQVPGGKTFKLIVAACGFLTSIFALIISFFPPSQLVGKSIHEYLTILSVSFVVTVLIPFVIYSITSKKSR